MENFHGFFPNSSSSSSSSTSLLSLNLTNSFDNGILGLMADHTEVPYGTLNIAVNNKGFHENNSSLVGTTTKTEVKTENKMKKGENKKMRKARYAFRTRSHVDILDDGYRWRKYGQKAVKNNKFPRNYYRCTQQGCSVKKQVQRLSKDEGIVETTYEGMHSHPIQKTNDNFEHILNQMQIYNTSSF